MAQVETAGVTAGAEPARPIIPLVCLGEGEGTEEVVDCCCAAIEVGCTSDRKRTPQARWAKGAWAEVAATFRIATIVPSSIFTATPCCPCTFLMYTTHVLCYVL